MLIATSVFSISIVLFNFNLKACLMSFLLLSFINTYTQYSGSTTLVYLQIITY